MATPAIEINVNATELKSGSWREVASVAESVAVTLSADVTELPAEAFADCKNLVSVTCVPGSKLRRVGELAFMGCSRLENIVLPSTVTELGNRCFLECESLSSITIPEGVADIPSHCFEWCEKLQHVALPSKLKKIGSAAFMYCFSLRDINIPKSVTEIGSNAFTECRSLTELILPPSIRELGSYIASECISLREATLPSGLRLMGELMFSGCRNLEILRVNTAIPPKFECESFIFEPDEKTLYEKCHLLVPTPEAYRRAHGWKMFTNISTL